MSAIRLTTYGVCALGVSMVAVGLLFIGNGIPIVRMELGWTQIMSGSVAASAGCIVVVLGLVLHHLHAMRDTMERLILPLPVIPLQAGAQPPDFAFEGGAIIPELRPLHPLAPAAKRDWPFVDEEEVRPEPALTAALHPAEPGGDVVHAPAEPPLPEPVLVQSAPALVFEEQEEVAHGPAVAAPDPIADPLADTPAAAPRPNFLASFLARRATGSSLPAAPDDTPPLPSPMSFETGERILGHRAVIPSRRTSIDLSSGWDEEITGRERLSAPEDHEPVTAADPEPADEPAFEAAQDAEPVDAAAPHPDMPATPDPVPDAVAEATADPLQPVVVGRYNAGAAAYVMYSNGMIEVETEQGTHQFASMQDLKAFIERRDAQVS